MENAVGRSTAGVGSRWHRPGLRSFGGLCPIACDASLAVYGGVQFALPAN